VIEDAAQAIGARYHGNAVLCGYGQDVELRRETLQPMFQG
jgi:hypothetical protein